MAWSVRNRAIALTASAVVVVGLARVPALGERLGAALHAFRDPSVVVAISDRPPLTVECGLPGPPSDTGALLDQAIAKDFTKATDLDLEDPSGATLATLTLPDLRVPVTRRTMRFVRFFTKNSAGRAAFTERFRRGGRYRETIEHALREAGLPEDLAWLAAVESGYNPQAVSSAGASGLFQFMPETGALYGLYVSPFVDERRSIVRSTGAAVAHLRDLYERFRRWDLALAAYNLGYEGVVRAMDRATALRRAMHEPPRAIEFADLAEARLIPNETASYVPQIMAFAIVAANRGRFGLDTIEAEPPLELGEIAVPEGTRLRTIARAAGISIELLRDDNPQLLRDRVPTTGGDYLVELPADRIEHALTTLSAYIDHEVLDAEDTAEAEVASSLPAPPLRDEPLARRPIALGSNRLPEFELPNVDADRLALGSWDRGMTRGPMDASVLRAKLPIVMVGGGTGWQQVSDGDPLRVFASGGRPANGKGGESAVDKELAVLGTSIPRPLVSDAFERSTLPNGLAMELREDRAAPFVTITVRLAESAPDARAEEAGASLGEARHTITVAPRDLDVGIELALGRLRLLQASSGDAALETIRRRASAPRRKALLDRPYGQAWLALGDALFPEGHALAGTVIGARSDPSTARDLLLADAIQRERSATRATVILIGNVDRERAEARLGKAVLDRSDGSGPLAPFPSEERHTIEEAVPSTRALYGWIAPGASDPEDAAMRVAVEVLCGPKSSRLEAALVGERLAATVHGELDVGERGGLAAIEVTPAVPHDVADVERAMDGAIAKLAADGPTWRELALAKVLIKLRLEKERASAQGPVVPGAPLTASSARMRLALHPEDLDAKLKAVEAVTAQQVRAIIHRVLSPAHRVVVTTVPRAATIVATRSGMP